MVKVVLSTGVIFLAILAIRKLFRGKAGNVFLYAIWLLFAAGLVVPILSFALREMAGWEQSEKPCQYYELCGNAFGNCK